ncbi:MAG: Cytochrome c oxidase cbb3-type subunit 4 [Hydrocarboniphaga sp.]|uniref:cbb3-type cytochrome oxidase subunit 3 n=1 Tax=Hydrocarboniphaga sp. TaxID=2033016 RepID=UPI00261BA48A|nr:cbb3-type cytochrome c oxidase subunit 3 [Hydrocarboniphaga sp.]MDB5971352.1 Cytochrome c oxidase cbb3-type subunit 4 [Hydrocarboniphaga sp.]
MNSQLLHDGLVQGLVTLIAFSSFIGICFYAYSPSRRKTFEQAARLPMADDAVPPEEMRK